MQRFDLEECQRHTLNWKCRTEETGKKYATMLLFVWAYRRFGLMGEYQAFLCSSSKMKQEVTEEVNNVQKFSQAQAEWNLGHHHPCWHCSAPVNNGHCTHPPIPTPASMQQIFPHLRKCLHLA